MVWVIRVIIMALYVISNMHAFAIHAFLDIQLPQLLSWACEPHLLWTTCPCNHEGNCTVCSTLGLPAWESVCLICNTHHTVSFPGAVYFNMQNMSSMYALTDPPKRSSIVPGAALGALAYIASLALKNVPTMHPLWMKIQCAYTILSCTYVWNATLLFYTFSMVLMCNLHSIYAIYNQGMPLCHHMHVACVCAIMI